MKKTQILSFIQEINMPCRTTDISSHFDMSTYQARHYLMCLEKEGKIRRT
ncbi:FaeA/PapI family transcriptional regulator, partial [Escherichia coli]